MTLSRLLAFGLLFPLPLQAHAAVGGLSAQEPTNSALGQRAAGSDADAALQRARACKLKGETSQAEQWAARYVEILEQRAERGDVRAMMQLGADYRSGHEFIKKDEARAITWFCKAVEAGEPSAACVLGALYKKQGREEDSRRAYATACELCRTRLAADAADADALYWLGYLELNAFGTEKQLAAGLEKLERAASLGDIRALRCLHETYTCGKEVAIDLDRAAGYAERLVAITGDPMMANRLAHYFMNLDGRRFPGRGADENDKKGRLYLDIAVRGHHANAMQHKAQILSAAGRHAEALTLFAAAADMGNELSMTEAAITLLSGRGGVEVDETRALRYLTEAAERKLYAPAFLLLGDYHATRGEQQAANAAYAKAYQTASLRYTADPGDSVSLYCLGYLEQRGLGTAQDKIAGFEKIKQAADMGHRPAAQRLSTCYRSGIGTAVDEAAAKAYARRASGHAPN